MIDDGLVVALAGIACATLTGITVASLRFAERIERLRPRAKHSSNHPIVVGADEVSEEAAYIDDLVKQVDHWQSEFHKSPIGSGSEMIALERVKEAKKKLIEAMKAASKKS